MIWLASKFLIPVLVVLIVVGAIGGFFSGQAVAPVVERTITQTVAETETVLEPQATVTETKTVPRSETTVKLGENAVERRIEMEADGEVLHYQEVYVWNENYFHDIVENQPGFRSAVRQFKETYDVSADNFRVEFDGKRNSMILRCDVHDKLSGSTYTFHWFLNPLGLDFINSNFVKSERELSWEGSIDGIATTITLRFPFTINHCHAHVWPR